MKQTPSRAWRRRILWVTVLLLLIAGGAVVVTVTGWPWHPVEVAAGHGSESAGEKRPSVKTIRPKLDTAFKVTVRQLASIEPFLEAGLRARASGVVRSVYKEIGERVQHGELLIEIDVPELDQEVAQKESVIDQRKQELHLAEVKVKDAEVQIKVAEAGIAEKETELAAAEATRDRQQKRLARYKVLARRDSLSPDLVDEQELDTIAAEEAANSARVAVEKAEADLAEKKVALDVAIADVELKKSLVTVAIKDRDRAQAVADNTRITAPFDGVVTDRSIDVGDFVQNATTGQTRPLMTVARTDFVTVVAHLPANVAPFVTEGTPVRLDLDEQPGVVLEARVTRLSPSLQGSDRTMRVEVDLFNGSEDRHRQLVEQVLGRGLAGLGGANALTAAGLVTMSRKSWAANSKGAADGVPPRPQVIGPTTDQVRLLPGTTEYVNVQLQQFRQAYLLPSGAVYSRGGKSYILVVRDGKSHEVPVHVQVNDGVLAKVAVVVRKEGAGGAEELHELTGKEEIISSRQVEIGDGRPVKPARVDW